MNVNYQSCDRRMTVLCFCSFIEVSVDFIQIIVTKYQKPDIFKLNCGALKAGCTGCLIFLI